MLGGPFFFPPVVSQKFGLVGTILGIGSYTPPPLFLPFSLFSLEIGLFFSPAREFCEVFPFVFTSPPFSPRGKFLKLQRPLFFSARAIPYPKPVPFFTTELKRPSSSPSRRQAPLPPPDTDPRGAE